MVKDVGSDTFLMVIGFFIKCILLSRNPHYTILLDAN